MRKVGSWVVAALACGGAGCAFDETFDDDDDVVAKKDTPVCKDKRDKKKPPKKDKCKLAVTVGATGGTIDHPDGASLTIPAGALDHDVQITVRDDGAPGPAGTTMFSPVFTFEPDGLQFARPVQVQFDVAPSVTAATVYWSRITPSGLVWDRLGAAVNAGLVTSQIIHFSGGGAGTQSSTVDLPIDQVVTYYWHDGVHNDYTIFSPGVATAYPPSAPEVDAEAVTDGQGIIHGLPHGAMWIRVNDVYVWYDVDSSPSLDVGSARFGRFPVVAASPGVYRPLTLNISGAAPLRDWDDDPATLYKQDSFELLVPDADTFFFGFPEDIGEPLGPDNATDFSLTWDLSIFDTVNNIISVADQMIVAQMVFVTSSTGVGYKQMTKIGFADQIAVPQAGGMTDVHLDDLTADPANTHSFTIEADKYQAMFHDGSEQLVNPHPATTSGWATDVRVVTFDTNGDPGGGRVYFDVQGEAFKKDVGVIGATADFAFMNLEASVAAAGPIVTGDLSYGVPAGDWDVFAGYGGLAFAAYQLRCPDPDPTPCPLPSGFAQQYPGHAVFSGFGDNRDAATTSFSPLIGRPLSFQISGQDARNFVTNAGAHPTISWAPDLTGTLIAPQLYEVEVSRLELDSSLGHWRTKRIPVATFLTPLTSVTIPTTLMNDVAYTVAVRATWRSVTGGINPLAEPLRSKNPSANWRIASAAFRVNP
jgi:hypothetical protein